MLLEVRRLDEVRRTNDPNYCSSIDGTPSYQQMLYPQGQDPSTGQSQYSDFEVRTEEGYRQYGDPQFENFSKVTVQDGLASSREGKCKSPAL